MYGAIAQTNPVVNENSAIIATEKMTCLCSFAIVSDCRTFPLEPVHRRGQRSSCPSPINTDLHLDHVHRNAAYAKMCGSRIDVISTNFGRAALEQAGRWFSGFLERRQRLQRKSTRFRDRRCITYFYRATSGLKRRDAQRLMLDSPDSSVEIALLN